MHVSWVSMVSDGQAACVILCSEQGGKGTWTSCGGQLPARKCVYYAVGSYRRADE